MKSISSFLNRKILIKKINNIFGESPVKLHFGCGNDYFPGYVNVDCDGNSKTDLVLATEQVVLIPSNSVAVIESYHFFEHLTYYEARWLLAQWYRILMPGGTLILELPDIDVCIKELDRHFNQKNIDLAMVGIFGYPPEVARYGLPYIHKWGWSHESLAQQLQLIGFQHPRSGEVRQKGREAYNFKRDMNLRALAPIHSKFMNTTPLLCKSKNLIYLPIPKVACTSLKHYCLEIEGFSYEYGIDRSFHELVQKKLSIKSDGSVSGLQQVVNSDEFLKFAVVRNPWDRLLSAFLDKFVRASNLEDFAVDLILELGFTKENFNIYLNFDIFVDFISKKDWLDLDVHWRPQSWFLAGFNVDKVIKYECLDTEFPAFMKQFDVSTSSLQHLNQGVKKIGSISARKACEDELWSVPVVNLRGETDFPGYRHWFSKDMLAKFDLLYTDDMKRFQYEF